MDKYRYEDLLRMRTITKLPEAERDSYISFHEKTWKEDLKTAELLMDKSPKWSVVAGYYAMHDLAKLFLAKKFNIKISGKFVHVAAIEALRKFLKDGGVPDRLEDALETVPPRYLPDFLELGKRERSKTQYYSGREFETRVAGAGNFLETVVKPFTNSMAGML